MAGYKTCYKTFHRSCKNLGWRPVRRTLAKHILPIGKGEHMKKGGRRQRAQVAETVGPVAPMVHDAAMITTSMFFF